MHFFTNHSNMVRFLHGFVITFHRAFSHMSRCTTKATKWPMRPVKTQSSLSAWRNLVSLATQWVPSEDSDRIGRMRRLVLVFVRLFVLFCRAVAHILWFCCLNFLLLKSYYRKHYQQCTMSRLVTKPTKWLCAQRRLRSARASAQSDQSLHCLHG